ncbi:MAG: hypothetical protein ACLP62_05480 [Acidimicrobiales bacterium]
MGWWIGVLFAVGSFCFALGSFPPYTNVVGAMADNVTYFVGSLFFTTAAFLQYCQVAWADGGPDLSHIGQVVRQLVRPRAERIDWWASGVQLIGTLFFNVSTGHAVAAQGGPSTLNHLVWRPDALGSVCFLVASWLCWAEVSHGAWCWRPRALSWWIAMLNLVGSIAFGASAIASKVEPSGSLRSLALTNLGTFVGAVCFLVGGVLLLPERTEGEGDEPELAAAAYQAQTDQGVTAADKGRSGVRR